MSNVFMQTCRAYHCIDVSSLYPVEDIPPSKETELLETPNITSPDLDPHELDCEVDDDDPTLEHDFTPHIAVEAPMRGNTTFGQVRL